MKDGYPQYRPSGVEWLGKVPRHWGVKRLKLVASINDDALSDKEDPLRPIGYVDIGSVNSAGEILEIKEMVYEDAPSRARRLVKDGDTILSTVRTYLRAIASVRKPSPEMVVSTGFAVIRPQSMEKDFASWVLKEYGFVEEVVARSTGVSYPATNPPRIANLLIPVPPANEQQAIAEFLDRETGKIDGLVAKNRRLIERLEEYRKALISRTVTRGLLPDAARAAGLNPSPRYRNSGVDWLGEIPEHWKVNPFRRVLREPLKYGANEAADLDDPDLPRFVRITDIDDLGHLRDETFYSLPAEVAAPYLLEPGDLLFARSGRTVGRTFLYDDSWGPCAYAGYLIRARVDRTRVLPEFVSHFSASKSYKSWLRAELIQATIENVSAGRYAGMPIPIPPLEEQRAISEFLDRETERIDALSSRVEVAIKRLLEYRSALITAAVTGKVDVRDSELVGTAGCGA